MIYKGRKIKIAILLIIVAALMFSTIWIMMSKATEDSEDVFQGSYTIEYLIKHYNLVTRNNVALAEDIIGPILVGGDIESTLFHSKITNNISSYVKGKILNGGNISPNDGYTPTFYVGNVNDVQGNAINGFPGYVDENKNKIVKTDDYIDFDSLYSSIRTQSKNLAEGTIVTPDESGKIEIEIGETVTIESLDNVSSINIIGNMNSTDVTLINIKQTGNINFPTVSMNNSQVSTNGSSNAGVAIVWNLPNASKIKFFNHPFIGHLIAPDADLESFDTNYAGCFIVKSLSGHIEGHFYPYNNGTLPIYEEPEENPDDKEPEEEDPKEDPDDKDPEEEEPKEDPDDKDPEEEPKEDPDNRDPEEEEPKEDPDDKDPEEEEPKEDPDNRDPEEEEPEEDPDNRDPEEEEPEEDPVDREPQNDTEDPVDRNTTKGNKTNKVDNTISKTKLPQTGEGLDKEIVLVAILMVLVAVFGIKYVVHSNKFDANK